MPGSSPTDTPLEARAALAQAIFNPRTIALIGALGEPGGLASRPERVLRRHGYPGTIVKVGIPQADSAQDVYHSLEEFKGSVDHAHIMVSPAAAAAAVASCAAAGVKVATLFSAGFAERGRRGMQRQADLVAIAQARGMRLIGPNSLGVVDVFGHVALSANAVLEHETLRPGPLGVISQSGSMLGALLTRGQARGFGFSRLVSIGNECDLSVGEILQLMVDDPSTRAVLLFLETLRDSAKLAAAARHAFEAGKPVIALKLGRSDLGCDLAASHTGGIVGSDEASSAFFRAHGILRVTALEALFETAQLVLGQRPPKGRRVAVVTVSAGAAALVVDRLGLAGIDAVAPPPELAARLASRRIRVGTGPVIDLPMGRADGGSYAAALTELLSSDHCDLVLAVQGSNAAYIPESVRERVLAAGPGGKPLAVFIAPHAPEALSMLHAHGVAGFRTPEACADAIRAYCDWRAPAPLVSGLDAFDPIVRAAVAAAGHGTLDEVRATQLLSGLGIRFTRSVVIDRSDTPVDLPFPVAAKIVSADIIHKTDAQGVELDIPDRFALREQIDAMLARCARLFPQAHIDGVLVQAMERGLGEVLIGFRRDPEAGPIVVLGAGGTLTGLFGDHAVRLAPVTRDVALEMILSVPALAAIRGYRGRPCGDLAALADALHRISLLALAISPCVVEAEINPLIVRVDGVVGVDAFARVAAP